ncbi:hypothetical protein O6H91_06G032400 [Diphasiastrum complanatum]|uniref:Uncharacterized protein n=4 Tax=Diphasiastrum complanatum TaxID=34168 RepID=A0ACC2DCK1_DIPCM|nr:hypothetical protein O6H91_06G032400 [Diphasiastrum complanatum]KAJ7551856.1 hypothetical protein O6H91_06G032400 [Diphasiastrum complanatum]KAJ7551857.1 hypothetical protein O6H91_06G032400 [Diphasiastrum complanatum]
MPLFKRTAFQLLQPPADLKPDEPVFHIRFTKEVIREYQEYLHRINLYRQKVWTCKVTGKQSLTYEQALLSESKATEKVQQFPKEFMGPVLHMVQFSVLGIHELVDRIHKNFKEQYVIGEIVAGIHGDSLLQCKIMKVFELNDQSGSCEYEVCWLNGSGKRMDVSRESSEKLSRQRYPLTKGLLKSFIRESAFAGLTRNSPWLVHDKLARKFKLHMEPSEELRQAFLGQNPENRKSTENGQKPVRKNEDPGQRPVAVKKSRTKHIVLEIGGLSSRKRKDITSSTQDESLANGEKSVHKRRKKDGETLKIDEMKQQSRNGQKTNKKNHVNANPLVDKCKKKLEKMEGGKKKSGSAKSNTKKIENIDNHSKSKIVKEKKTAPIPEPPPPICYPIDDLLVQPSPDDPTFTERPVPSTNFALPMECIGKFLMVWNFFISFGKAIHLSPFSSEDFEKALCYKDGEVSLLTEAYYALLRTVCSDPEIIEEFMLKRKRKSEMSMKTWKGDLCDILESGESQRFKSLSSVIRQGSYKQLDPSSKLEVLHELVERSLSSTVVRNQLEENIDEHQAIAARKREEVVGQSKKKKDEQDRPADLNLGPDREAVQESVGQLDGICPNNKQRLMEVHRYETQEAHSDAENRELDGRLHKQIAVKHIEDKDTVKMSEEQRKIQEKKKEPVDLLAEHEQKELAIVDKQKREEHFEREMEKHSIRTSSLGKDRNFNQYWFFNREDRIFIESKDSAKWGYYGSKEELDALLGSLNIKGVREKALKRHLEKRYVSISSALQKRSKDIALKVCIEEASLRRSVRVRLVTKPAPFLTYVNRYRNT